jgi:hypothetical protein
MTSLKEMMINLACIENGIVPLCSGKSGHVKDVLNSLSPQQRRKTTRRFRKLLKRAIHTEALQSGPDNSFSYYSHKQFLSRVAGLLSAHHSSTSSAQSVFRAKMVRDYLQRTSPLDN